MTLATKPKSVPVIWPRILKRSVIWSISLDKPAAETLMARYARDLIKFSTQGFHNSRSTPSGLMGAAKPHAYVEYKTEESSSLCALHCFCPTDSRDNNTELEKKMTSTLLSRLSWKVGSWMKPRPWRSALQQGMDPLTWMPRLAQVAQWNNHPETALQYWFEFAQASGDAQAWTTVRSVRYS